MILLTLLILLLAVVIESLIFWGVVNLTILAFSLNITFTFLQAMAIILILNIIKSIFK